MSKNIDHYFKSSADFVATYNQFIEEVLDNMVENISIFSISVKEKNEMDIATQAALDRIKEYTDAILKEIANTPETHPAIQITEQKKFRAQANQVYKKMRLTLIKSINDKVIGDMKGELLDKFNLSANTLDSLNIKTNSENNTAGIFSFYKSLTLLDDYFIELHNALSRHQPDTDIPALGTNESIKATALANMVSKHFDLLLK